MNASEVRAYVLVAVFVALVVIDILIGIDVWGGVSHRW